MSSVFAVVVGGGGALGRAITKKVLEVGVKVINVDFIENTDAAINIHLSHPHSWNEQVDFTKQQINEKLDFSKQSINGVVCVAGSWEGGFIGDNNAIQTCQNMLERNLKTALGGAHISSVYMKENPNGLLVLTGAMGAMAPAPGMIGYGISKAATHYLVKSLAHDDSDNQFTTVGILPNVIDTKMNRIAMPDADFSQWTPPMDMASSISQWLISPETVKPLNGALIEFQTNNGITTTEVLPYAYKI